MEKLITKKDIAKELDMAPISIIYYINQGYIKPKKVGTNGYNYFTREAIEIIRYIRLIKRFFHLSPKHIKYMVKSKCQGAQFPIEPILNYIRKYSCNGMITEYDLTEFIQILFDILRGRNQNLKPLPQE